MKKFTTQELNKIKTAVIKAERKTTGEIVPIIIPQADDYFEGQVTFSLLSTIIFSFGYLHYTQWKSLSLFIAGQVITFALSFALTYFFPAIKLWFINKSILAAKTNEHALGDFFRYGIGRTKEHTGILIALFLLEKRVEIIADAGINERCNQKTWDSVVKTLTSKAKQGKVAEGFADSILACGKILAKEFPAQNKNPNELRDNIIIE